MSNRVRVSRRYLLTALLLAPAASLVSGERSGRRAAAAVVRPGDREPLGMPTAAGWPPNVFHTSEHTALWTGSEMIIWSGHWQESPVEQGVAYNPTTDIWRFLATKGAPSARYHNSGIWTGKEMIIWGGGSGVYGPFRSDGARYNPTTDSWTPLPTSGPLSPRSRQATVWTGKEMIVWGGRGQSVAYADGAKYDPASNTWSPISSVGAPSARHDAVAVWTGSEMIIWGGEGFWAHRYHDGARYNPTTDTWTPISANGAPSDRIFPRGVWTGSELLVWVGRDGGYPGAARYNLATDSWATLSLNGMPSPRYQPSLVWTGREMVVWGGQETPSGMPLSDGARYDPATDSWTPLPTEGSPARRRLHTAVWTGDEMIVWGGTSTVQDGSADKGGRWNQATNRWTTVKNETGFYAYFPFLVRNQIVVARPVRDNFSNAGSGWPSSDDDLATRGYADGEYRILVKQEGYLVGAGRNLLATDFLLEVDVRATIHAQGAMGVYFALSEAGYYLFEIAFNQFHLLRYERATETWHTLIPVTWLADSNRNGLAKNHLVVRRIGTSISLHANEWDLVKLTDGALGEGFVGLTVGAFEANFEARFDNFVLVYDPQYLLRGAIAPAAGPEVNTLSHPGAEGGWPVTPVVPFR